MYGLFILEQKNKKENSGCTKLKIKKLKIKTK